MRTQLPRSRTATALLTIAAAALLAGSPAAPAGAASVSLVARHAESLEVGPGMEHRLLIVHPVLARPVVPARADAVSLGGVASPDLLAFGQMEKNARPRTDAVNFGPAPAALLTGDVLRTETADFAVARDTVVPAGKPSPVSLVRISRDAEADAKAAEPAMLGQVLPSALRYLLLCDVQGPAVRDASERWAAEVKLATPRRSPAELRTADLIAKRAADYRHVLATLPKPAPDREIVGCAILLDGALTSFETFASGKTFADAWPRLLDGAATEAAVQEVVDDLLTADLADPADPDRFLSGLKRRLIDVFAARVRETDVGDGFRQATLSLDDAAATALVADDRVLHFVLVTDPAHRFDKPPGEGPDPRAAERKARPTEEEKRLIDRRNGGSAAPAPPDPPPPK